MKMKPNAAMTTEIANADQKFVHYICHFSEHTDHVANVSVTTGHRKVTAAMNGERTLLRFSETLNERCGLIATIRE
jgi:hypothetical protein